MNIVLSLLIVVIGGILTFYIPEEDQYLLGFIVGVLSQVVFII